MTAEVFALIVCLSLCAGFGAVWLYMAFFHSRSIVPPMHFPHVTGVRVEKEGAEFYKPAMPPNRVVKMGLNGFDIGEKPIDNRLRNPFIGSGWY